MSLPVRGAVLATLVLALLVAPHIAQAHEGNPNYRSTVTAIRPDVPGVRVEVLNYDDRLALLNRGSSVVTIEGYDGEPYARVWPDGPVEINRRSPARYLNDDRFAQVAVPPTADADAEPAWDLVGRNGRFEWHDHRTHWMVADRRPPQVTDEQTRTKILDWKVPMRVGERDGAITGELLWVGLPGGDVPTGAWVALGALLLGSAALVPVARGVENSGYVTDAYLERLALATPRARRRPGAREYRRPRRPAPARTGPARRRAPGHQLHTVVPDPPRRRNPATPAAHAPDRRGVH